MLTRRGFIRALTAVAATPAVAISNAAPALARTASLSWPAEHDPRYWDKLRDHFLLREDEVFFNTATLGAQPREVVDAVADSMRSLAGTMAEWDYKPDHPNWFTGYSHEDPLRDKLAALIHADREEIALIQNATMGMNFVAGGLDLVPGDEILQTDQEHVGAKSCWELLQKRHGVVWKTVAMPVPAREPQEIVARIEQAITPKTKVIAWPHVTSQLGTVMPVQAISTMARARGIFTVIDGAQAIGQIPVDVRAIGCDAWIGSPHKWLLAPAGNGLLYVRRDQASRVWTTLASGEWANEKDPGLRFQQRGTGNLSLLVGLDAAIEFHRRVGPERWFARIRQLGDYLRTRLAQVPGATIASSLHPEMRAGMTTWKLEGHPPYAMVDAIWAKARIRPRAVSDLWGMRTSTMIYNNEREIDRLIAAAQQVAKEAPKG